MEVLDLEQINILITKLLTGEISSQERKFLKEWLARSPENRKIFKETEKTWNLFRPAKPGPLPDIGREWQSLACSLRLEGAPSTRVQARTIRLQWPRLTWGLSLRPVLVGLGVLILISISLFLYQVPPGSLAFQEITTLKGQKSQIVLAEGSRITLNASSKVHFRKPFPDNIREVLLDGEAFFEVTPDTRPFVVVTGNARTTVLGTAFNVRSRDGRTSVVVKSGRVKVTGGHGTSDVILVQDQMSCVAAGGTLENPSQVDVNKLLGWLEGKLVFEKAPLFQILGELMRTYDVVVRVDHKSLEGRTLTATFNADDLSIETVLASICLTLGAEYRTEGERYIIY